MNANECFEVFAEKFYKKFGYLPCGKSDPLRPDAERILIDLGETYGALLKAESAKTDTQQLKDSISLLKDTLIAIKNDIHENCLDECSKNINVVIAKLESI